MVKALKWCLLCLVLAACLAGCCMPGPVPSLSATPLAISEVATGTPFPAEILPVTLTFETPTHAPTPSPLLPTHTPCPTPTSLSLPSNEGSALLFLTGSGLADGGGGAPPAMGRIAAGDPLALVGATPEPVRSEVLGQVGDLESSPNGRWVAIITYSEQGSSTQVLDVATGLAEQIEPRGYSGPADFLGWAPGGDTVILRVSPVIDDAIVLIGVETGFEELLDTPEYTYDAALSPDGERVMYALSEGWGFGSELWVMDRNGRNRQLILKDTEHIITNPCWSPTRDAMAYILMEDGLTPFTVGELWLADGAGRNPQVVAEADAGHNYPLVWSPDGRWVAFVVRENSEDAEANSDPAALESNIYLADARSGEVRAATTFEGVLVGKPVWSPDGQWLAFSSSVGGTSDLWLVNIATGQLQQVTQGADVRYPVWLVSQEQAASLGPPTPTSAPTVIPSPTPTAVLGPIEDEQTTTSDGVSVVSYRIPTAGFSGGVVVGSQVFVIDGQRRLIAVDLLDLDAGGRVVGHNVYCDILRPVRVAPQVDAVIYVTLDDAARKSKEYPVVSLDLSTGKSAVLGTTRGYPPRFGVAATGSVLLLEDGRLVLKNADGTAGQDLSAMETKLELVWSESSLIGADFTPQLDFLLSPDGNQIALFDGEQVRVLGVDGQPVINIPLNTEFADGVRIFPNARFVAWSPDGRQIAFLEGIHPSLGASLYWQGLRVVDITNGTSFYLTAPEAEVGEAPGRNAAWSPDGTRIAFSDQYMRLYIAGVDGTVIASLGQTSSESLAWSAAGDAVFFACDQNGEVVLCVAEAP